MRQQTLLNTRNMRYACRKGEILYEIFKMTFFQNPWVHTAQSVVKAVFALSAILAAFTYCIKQFLPLLHFGKNWQETEATGLFLSAVTLEVTLLGGFLAIGAIVGYHQIKKDSLEKVETFAQAFLKDKKFQSELQKMATEIIREQQQAPAKADAEAFMNEGLNPKQREA